MTSGVLPDVAGMIALSVPLVSVWQSASPAVALAAICESSIQTSAWLESISRSQPPLCHLKTNENLKNASRAPASQS